MIVHLFGHDSVHFPLLATPQNRVSEAKPAPLLDRGFLEIMHEHHAKAIELGGVLQDSRRVCYGFVCGEIDQHKFGFLIDGLFRGSTGRLHHFLESLLISTTSRTTAKVPITVHTHIPPPDQPPINPSVWSIIKSSLIVPQAGLLPENQKPAGGGGAWDAVAGARSE